MIILDLVNSKRECVRIISERLLGRYAVEVSDTTGDAIKYNRRLTKKLQKFEGDKVKIKVLFYDRVADRFRSRGKFLYCPGI